MNENAFKVLDLISQKPIVLNSTTSKSLGLGWDEFLKQIEYLENNEYISEVEFGSNEYSITEIGLKKILDLMFLKQGNELKITDYFSFENHSELSFFDRVKKIWNSIPSAKRIYEMTINSTISKVTSIIISTVIGGLLILIIWAIYENQLIELWKRIFT